MEKCNGWTNYPTWCMYCWLTNDEGSYNYYKELAEEEDISTYTLHEIIKTDCETLVYDTVDNSGWICDLLTFAVDCVNWYEIAEAFKDEAKE